MYDPKRAKEQRQLRKQQQINLQLRKDRFMETITDEERAMIPELDANPWFADSIVVLMLRRWNLQERQREMKQ